MYALAQDATRRESLDESTGPGSRSEPHTKFSLLLSLPSELVLHILSFARIPDIISFRQVCLDY